MIVHLAADGLEEGQPHAQHIHGRFDANGAPVDSVSPTLADDTDGDGFIEVGEGAAAYGPIILPLDDEEGSFPTAEDGTISYTRSFDLNDDELFEGDFEVSDALPLELREVVLHGGSVPEGAGEGTEGEVEGTGGYKAFLPVASGEFVEILIPDGVSSLVVAEVGEETLLGTDQNELILGFAGSSVMSGGAGDDLLVGGGDNDTLSGGAGADTLSGGMGDDVLVGGADDDLLAGNAGRDVAVFDAAFDGASSGVARSGGTLALEGDDTIENVEILVFSDRTTAVTLENAIDAVGFDEAGYLARNPDVAAAVAGGAFASGHEHFQLVGQLEGRSPTSVEGFDQTFYLDDNPDVAAAVAAGQFASAVDHFLSLGAAEGRDPNPLFDSAYYLGTNADVAEAVAAGGFNSAYQHFQLAGAAEGRSASEFFDTARYLEANPDVADAGVNALEHYLVLGVREGYSGYVTDDWSVV